MSIGVRKSAFIATVTIGAAIVAIVAIVPWLVSTDLVRNAIEREMSTFTGRPLSIGGDVSVNFFPSPTAVFDDVTFLVRGDEQQSILSIDNVEADIAPLTLLSRNPSFTEIRLTRPHLRLTRQIDGTINWRDSMARIGQAIDMARRRIESEGEPQKLLLDEFPKDMASIGIVDGTLTIDDVSNETMEEITAITGAIDWQKLDGALATSGTGSWRGIPFSIEYAASEPLALFAGNSTASNFSLQSELGSLTFDGVLDFYETLFAEGAVELSTPSTSALLEWLGTKIDAGRAIGALTLTGPVNLSNQRVRFEQASITIEENEGSGAIEISSPAVGPRIIAGTLEFQTLDLSSILGSFVTVPTSRWQFETPILLDFLSQMHTDLRLSAQNARFGNIEMSDLAATAQINEASAIFDIGDAQAYGGNVQARLQFNRGENDDHRALMSISGQGVDTRLVDAALELPSSVPLGIAQMSLDLEAPLNSWNGMSKTAKGRLMFKMNEGATVGFGINALMRNEQLNQFFTLSDDAQGQEAFTSLGIDAVLADGVATLETAEIVYEQGIVQINGVAPFGSGGIAMTATVQPNDGSEDDKTHQFFIGGSWDRAFATPLRLPVSLGE
ncbi:MAG: AsmA family protein [Pseudomonadota bacterium]